MQQLGVNYMLILSIVRIIHIFIRIIRGTSSLLEENKHNPRYLFNIVAKLTKNKTSTGVDISQQHFSNDFINYFTSIINTIRD